MSKAVEKGQPMDPSIREESTGTVHVNNPRVCWAAKTLVIEVEELFPETPVEFGIRDLRNTALSVTFDLTSQHGPDRDMLTALLELVDTDARVAEVVIEEDSAFVRFHSNPRIQDSRDPFGLADALDVLNDSERVSL